MKRDVGLWIDSCKAVIVKISYDGDGIKSTQSNVEKSVRFSGVLSQEGWVGNMHDRKFANYLASYYDDVISYIQEADPIQIFGPGEAKVQFEKRLRREDLGAHVVGIETVEKMTDRQIEGESLAALSLFIVVVSVFWGAVTGSQLDGAFSGFVPVSTLFIT